MTRKLPSDIVGQRVGGDPADEIDNFYFCAHCGQPVDMRDLGAVIHHEQVGHEPLQVEDAERLLRVSEMLRKAMGSDD